MNIWKIEINTHTGIYLYGFRVFRKSAEKKALEIYQQTEDFNPEEHNYVNRKENYTRYNTNVFGVWYVKVSKINIGI